MSTNVISYESVLQGGGPHNTLALVNIISRFSYSYRNQCQDIELNTWHD